MTFFAALGLLSSFFNPWITLPAQADFTRPIDVVSVSWPQAATPSTTVAAVRTAVDAYATPYWHSHASIDFTRGMDASAPVKMDGPAPCDGDATVAYMNEVASKFYVSQGLNVGTRYLVLLLPQNID